MIDRSEAEKLIERLTTKASMIEMGEKIAWGSDSALMYEAADALSAALAETERLRTVLAEAREIIEAFSPLTDEGSRSRRFLEALAIPTDVPLSGGGE